MDSLKLGVESAIHTSSGVLAFCWARISNVLSKRTDPTFKLEVGKAKAASHTATLVRPKNESKFYEMIHLFIMLIVALSMASYTIVRKFFDDIVYSAVRVKESWKVAPELPMLYLREIDIDPSPPSLVASRARRLHPLQGHDCAHPSRYSMPAGSWHCCQCASVRHQVARRIAHAHVLADARDGGALHEARRRRDHGHCVRAMPRSPS